MTLTSPAMITETPRRLALCLTVLAAAQLIFSLDINIVFVALPDIGADLGFTSQSLQWVVGSYAVFAGGFLLLGGRAADLLGRRRVFLVALSLYAVSSLAGGLATSPMTIVIARAVQGIGGALLLPSTLALVTTLFAEGPSRNKALAVWGGAGASGLTIGALLGGVLTQSFGWQAVFFVNIPLAATVIIVASLVIPADPPRVRGRHFDVPCGLTGTVAALLLVYAIVQGPISGWSSVTVILAAAGSAILAGIFVTVERLGSDPLLPTALLRNRALSIGATITFLYMATFGVLPYFLTVLFQSVHKLSALQTGLLFLIPSVAIATGTQLGGWLTTMLGARVAVLVGFGIGIPGTALLAVAFHTDSSLLLAVPGLLISGLGQGTTWTAMWVSASTGVAPEQQGVANAFASTTLSLGNAIGLAALTAVAVTTAHSNTPDGRAQGGLTAVLIAAAAMVLGFVAASALPRLPRRKSVTTGKTRG